MFVSVCYFPVRWACLYFSFFRTQEGSFDFLLFHYHLAIASGFFVLASTALFPSKYFRSLHFLKWLIFNFCPLLIFIKIFLIAFNFSSKKV